MAKHWRWLVLLLLDGSGGVDFSLDADSSASTTTAELRQYRALVFDIIQTRQTVGLVIEHNWRGLKTPTVGIIKLSELSYPL